MRSDLPLPSVQAKKINQNQTGAGSNFNLRCLSGLGGEALPSLRALGVVAAKLWSLG
jgi:hypothetical protein